jgi:hypothetical protein
MRPNCDAVGLVWPRSKREIVARDIPEASATSSNERLRSRRRLSIRVANLLLTRSSSSMFDIYQSNILIRENISHF